MVNLAAWSDEAIRRSGLPDAFGKAAVAAHPAPNRQLNAYRGKLLVCDDQSQTMAMIRMCIACLLLVERRAGWLCQC